ncbi:ricin-type beta-trefoil lectin domain protein [Streptomyces sp. BE282]|uniref:ricin-type beta-trefoil lectin domain protein n=1 Tax=Streptomyces TaxID=1883 RepID=UPI002E785DBF|nr:ricin-type beta-trefoil lectin domain protein [Streptomyces sp. BE282]MEE1728014.1 ricin-type beta-trefoil lectin domain protein [Streptomyces sp. BE282]
MTRSSSSQQTPVSPEARTESGAEGEGTAVNSAAGAAPAASGASAVPDTAAVPDSEPAGAKIEAAGAPQTPEASETLKAPDTPKAPEGEKSGASKSPEAAASTAGTAAADPGSTTTEAPAGTSGAAAGTPESQAGTPDSDPDPSASAAAQSRLPALVRTMSATAIGQPQQEAGPVGRPGKAALAGAAVVGALLVSVPFLVLAGNNDDGPKQTNAAAAGTVLDGSGQEAPGEFAVTAPETSAAAEDENGKKGEKGKDGEPGTAGNPVPVIPPAAAPSGGGEDAPKKEDAPKAAPKKADSPKAQPKKATGGAKNQPAKAKPAVTFSGPVSFRSHLSGRCLDVPGHNFNDGQRLFMWDCNGADAQKWRFGSDGTIRARDKCLDVANANFGNGTPIQLAWCNGSAAQKFTLNGAHDLVNTVVGKCVDIPNHSRDRGPSTYLILWECTGNDNQKWST